MGLITTHVEKAAAQTSNSCFLLVVPNKLPEPCGVIFVIGFECTVLSDQSPGVPLRLVRIGCLQWCFSIVDKANLTDTDKRRSSSR